jgi:hypothetical protein
LSALFIFKKGVSSDSDGATLPLLLIVWNTLRRNTTGYGLLRRNGVNEVKRNRENKSEYN